jgi:hypothetical protein
LLLPGKVMEQAPKKAYGPDCHRRLLTHRLTVFSPIRGSRAWSPCRAPGLGLEQELVALPETVPVETLRLFQTIAEPVLGHLALSRRELGEVP